MGAREGRAMASVYDFSMDKDTKTEDDGYMADEVSAGAEMPNKNKKQKKKSKPARSAKGRL